MEATIRGPRQGIPPQHTEPPEHLVEMLVPMWRPLPTGPAGPPPGSAEHAQAIRAQVRTYIRQIWTEAFHAGTAFGLAWSTQPIRLIVEHGDTADTLVEALLSARTREAVPNGC